MLISYLLEDFSVLLNNFSESLVFDLDSSDVNIVRVDFALQFSSAELHVQLKVEFLVSGELASVVLFVIGASSITALFAVDPHVSGTCVVNHVEAVISLAHAELAGVLCILEVVQGNRLHAVLGLYEGRFGIRLLLHFLYLLLSVVLDGILLVQIVGEILVNYVSRLLVVVDVVLGQFNKLEQVFFTFCV